MPARRQIENFLAFAVNFGLTGAVGITHHAVGVADIKPIAHQHHAVRHGEPGQENFAKLGFAVIIGVAEESDLISRFGRSIGKLADRFDD